MTEITSLNNPLVKMAASLHQKKYRDETQMFLVEGLEPCVQAIEQGWQCIHLFVRKDAENPLSNSLPERERGHAEETPSPLQGEGRGEGDGTIFVTHEILAKISKKDNPQPIIGVFQQRVNDTPEKADAILALEEIRDPGNLGTIMRTAHAVDIRHIILVGPCCDPFNPEVIRASMGSFACIRLTQMTTDAFIAWQKTSAMQMIGTDVVQAVDYREADYNNAIIVMGNEQKGLSDTLKPHCTTRVTIPMPGGTESLNLSIATALLLYQARGL